ncbi:hypothetical protein KUCAC02_035346, partial [Chaenocephalus aceratus]
QRTEEVCRKRLICAELRDVIKHFLLERADGISMRATASIQRKGSQGLCPCMPHGMGGEPLEVEEAGWFSPRQRSPFVGQECAVRASRPTGYRSRADSGGAGMSSQRRVTSFTCTPKMTQSGVFK